MRRFLPALTSAPLVFLTACTLSAESEGGEGEHSYLRALRGGGPLPTAPPAPQATVPRAPLDVHGINLSAQGVPVAGGSAVDSLYIASSLRAAHSGELQVVRVASQAQVAALGEEVAVVGIARGCDPCVTEALAASLEAAARLSGSGLTWYLVSDATPQGVVEALERRVRLEVPEAGAAAAALPMVAVLDRMGRRGGSKWLMPPSKALEFEEEGEGSSSALPLALIPYPSELAAFVGEVVAGRLEPTLIGEAQAAPAAAAAAAAAALDAATPAVLEVTSSTWAATVLDPSKDVLLEAYLSNCPMCLCLAPRVAMAAQVAAQHFPPTASIAVAAMNVDTNERPMAWMPSEAFPTLQMFNRGSKGGAHKLGGPACAHLAQPGAAQPSHSAGSISPSSPASPPCVPSVDFTHPSAPGKMALPTVASLVAWMASNCSAPFDAMQLQVPREAVRGSLSTSPWAPVFFPAAAAAAAAEGGASGAPSPPQRPWVPIAALLEDMDAECKVYEAGVFDSMFAGHVVELVGGAAASPPLPYPQAWAAMLLAAQGHAQAQGRWLAAGRDIRGYPSKEGPAPSLGGLPGVGGRAEWLAGHLPLLQANAQQLKAAVQGPAVAYGRADAAWAAIELAGEQSAACDARGVARAWMQDQDTLRAIAAALPMALALAEEERGRPL